MAHKYKKPTKKQREKVKQILESQTANLKFIEDPGKDREFTIHWVDLKDDKHNGIN